MGAVIAWVLVLVDLCATCAVLLLLALVVGLFSTVFSIGFSVLAAGAIASAVAIEALDPALPIMALAPIAVGMGGVDDSSLGEADEFALGITPVITPIPTPANSVTATAAIINMGWVLCVDTPEKWLVALVTSRGASLGFGI